MKKDTLIKRNSKLLAANNRVVRHEGKSWLVRVQQLGPLILADAEPLPKGGELVNVFGKGSEARTLRKLIEDGCFS